MRKMDLAIAIFATKQPNLFYVVMGFVSEGSGEGAARKYTQGRHAVFGFRMR